MNTIWFPDFANATAPKYQILTESLRDAVVAGQLDVGEKLPPVREVAWQLKITPGTVARAYTKLTEEGVLEAQVGRGTFVAGQKRRVDLPPDGLINLTTDEFADFRACRVPDVGQSFIFRDIYKKLAMSNSSFDTGYGTPEQDAVVRGAVTKWIEPDHVGSFTADDVVLAHGAQNATICALQATLIGANPTILTERLSYPGVRHAARLLRANLVGVKMDENGILPDYLEKAIRQTGAQVLLTSAEVHSPTTIKTSLERKIQIAALARKYNVTIIEDDCHRIAPTDVPAYRAIAPDVAYFISGLTKTISGALRFGYAVPPQGSESVSKQAAQSSFYGLGRPILDITSELILSGAAQDIRGRIKDSIEARVLTAVNAMGRWDIRWRVDAPFIWLKLPLGWRSSNFTVACEKRHILVKPADEFALPDAYSPHAVRLAINPWVADQQFETALDQINDLLSAPKMPVDA